MSEEELPEIDMGLPMPQPMVEMLPTDDPSVWAAEFCKRHVQAVVLPKDAHNETNALTVVDEATVAMWFTSAMNAALEMNERRGVVESQTAMGKVVKAPPLPQVQAAAAPPEEDNDE